MESKLVVCFLLILTIGCNGKKLQLGELRPYLMRFNLDFKEEKITDFIAESLFATNGWITSETSYCNITLSDVLSIIPYKKTAAADLNTAIDKLNLQIDDNELTNFIQNLDYTQLSYMGFSVGTAYKNFVKTYLAINPNQIVDVLNALEIGPEFAVAYAFGTDAAMFSALQEGNFSLGALSEIETIIGTKLTLKDLGKIFGFKKMNSLYFQQFINDYLTNYLTAKNLQLTNFANFLNSFMFEIDDYKSMKSFKTCYKALTQDVTLGVAVSGFEIITNDDSIFQTHMALQRFTTFTISAVQTKMPYPLSGFKAPQNYTNPFVTFEIATPLPQYIEKTTSYENISTKMCTYITIGSKKLVEQPTSVSMVDGKLKMSKTLLTSFKKGSPLICEGLLYGLAAEETMFAINFDNFEEEIKPSIDDIVENPEFMQAISNLFDQFDINPCDYFSCSPSVPAINEGVIVEPSIEEDEEDRQIIGDHVEDDQQTIGDQIEEDEHAEPSLDIEDNYHATADLADKEEGSQTIGNEEESINEDKVIEDKSEDEQGAFEETNEETVNEEVKSEEAIAEEQQIHNGVNEEQNEDVEANGGINENMKTEEETVKEQQNENGATEEQGVVDEVNGGIFNEEFKAEDPIAEEQQIENGTNEAPGVVAEVNGEAINEEVKAEEAIVVEEQQIGNVAVEQVNDQQTFQEESKDQAVAVDVPTAENQDGVNDQAVVEEQVITEEQVPVEDLSEQNQAIQQQTVASVAENPVLDEVPQNINSPLSEPIVGQENNAEGFSSDKKIASNEPIDFQGTDDQSQ